MLQEILNSLKTNDKKIELLTIKEVVFSGRPAQIKRCLVNIIENAKRYANLIKITLDRKNGETTITIEDNGTGIKSQNYNDVFRPFFTLDKSRNKSIGGSGLGMTISRDIARSHGGDIFLDKSSFGGLKVIINLPL